MDDALPSLTSNPGSVGSRFVSQNDIDSAKARRDEQWKAAYARLGQEPPPQPTEDVYDGRSLAEKLAANKIAKQEEWEEKTKLANQFRALEEDEVLFLDTIRAEEQRKEQKRKHEDAEEVRGFMEAVAQRNALPDKPAASAPTQKTAAPVKHTSANPSSATKKLTPMKNSLKGVIVKKKPAKQSTTADSKTTKADAQDANSEEEKGSSADGPSSKRPRLSSSRD